MLKNKFTIYSIISAFLLCNSLTVSAAKNTGDLEGLYIPHKGWAESQELTPYSTTREQLGKFKIILKRQGWHSLSNAEKARIRHKLVIKGVLHNLVLTPLTAPVISHQLSSNNRDGAVFTSNDDLFILGSEPCSEQPGAVVLNVLETLNFEYGIGLYQGLQAGGTVSFQGTLDNCTLQNDFEVLKDEGGLCFGSDSCD